MVNAAYARRRALDMCASSSERDAAGRPVSNSACPGSAAPRNTELRRVRRGLEHLLGVAVAGFATAQSTIYAWQMLKLDRRSDVMEIPMWVPHGALAVGLGAIVLIALWRFASEFLLGRPVGHAAPMSGRTQGDVA